MPWQAIGSERVQAWVRVSARGCGRSQRLSSRQFHIPACQKLQLKGTLHVVRPHPSHCTSLNMSSWFLDWCSTDFHKILLYLASVRRFQHKPTSCAGGKSKEERLRRGEPQALTQNPKALHQKPSMKPLTPLNPQHRPSGKGSPKPYKPPTSNHVRSVL